MKSHYFATLIVSVMAGSGLAHADSFQNASQAAADSAEASARLVASGVQVTLGATAVPLAASGAVANAGGSAANQIAGDLWDAANAPLTVDDDIAMAQPLPRLNQDVGPVEQAE
ncbi:MAG: hypothetical protein QNI84_12685 [Henriciella sp.]|nr:hypothetical protein [Henriciella sp.]